MRWWWSLELVVAGRHSGVGAVAWVDHCCGMFYGSCSGEEWDNG